MLSAFKILVEDDILAGKEEGGGEEVVLVWLFFVILFIESPFVFFKIFIEHIFAT